MLIASGPTHTDPKEHNKSSSSESSDADGNEMDNSQQVQLPKRVQEQHFPFSENPQGLPQKEGQQKDSSPEILQAYHTSAGRTRRSAHYFDREKAHIVMNLSDPVFYRWYMFSDKVFMEFSTQININVKGKSNISFCIS